MSFAERNGLVPRVYGKDVFVSDILIKQANDAAPTATEVEHSGSFETAASQRLIPIHERFNKSNGLAQQHGAVIAAPAYLDCFGRHRREECFEICVLCRDFQQEIAPDCQRQRA